MGVDFTLGWDAVVATEQKNINVGLRKAYEAGLLPHNVKTEFTFKVFGIDVTAKVEADLGAWSFAGGSGKNLLVSIPFTGGSIHIGNDNHDMKGVILNVTCLLTYIKSPIKPESGTDYILQLDFMSPKAIVAVDVQNVPKGLDPNTIDIVLLNLLKKTLGGHTYDIVKVNLGFISEDYPYAVPTLFEYAIDTNSTSPDSSVFGIQMLTTGKKPGNQDIIPGTIPLGKPTCDSAVLMSNPLFTEEILLPGLASAMSIDKSKLTTTGTTTKVIVNNGDIDLDTSHDPTVTSLHASIDNDLLSLEIIGNVEATPGINIDFTLTATYEMELGEEAGKQTISLKQKSHNTNHTVHVATWVIITAASVAALVAAVMGPIVGLIVAGIEALIIYLIATIANNKAGDILDSSLPANISNAVTWTHMDYFTIKQVLMPTPLQVGGVIPILSN